MNNNSGIPDEFRLIASLDRSIADAFEELAPATELSTISFADNTQVIEGQYACFLSIVGHIAGTLAIVCCASDAKKLGRFLASSLLGEETLEQNCGTNELSEIEDSMIRELANRIGSVLVDDLTDEEELTIRFPVLLDGTKLNIQWQHKVSVARTIQLEGFTFAAHLGLDRGSGERTTIADRHHIIDEFRSLVLSGGVDV